MDNTPSPKIYTITDMEPYLQEYEYEALVRNTHNSPYVSKKGVHPADYIDSAMYWAGTPEGESFWAEINDRLQNMFPTQGPF